MMLDDPELAICVADGQRLIFPSPAAWLRLVVGEPLGDAAIRLQDWVRSWLDTYSGYNDADLALLDTPRGWLPVGILRRDGALLRVHFEDVICECCNERCGPSATPDFVAYAGAIVSRDEVKKRFESIPTLGCPHCGEPLRQRQTKWLGNLSASKRSN